MAGCSSSPPITPRGACSACRGDPFAMADRRRTLDALLVSLAHPGVDGVLGSPDVLEELALLGALENKLAFGTMNRGGLMGASWELDDRMTAYDAQAIAECGLDGGKVLLRIADDDAGTAPTHRGVRACGQRVRPAAACRSWSNRCRTTTRRPGRAKLLDDDDALLRAVAVGASLGYTQLVDVVEGPGRQGPGADAGLHDAARADPRWFTGTRSGGDLRVVGGGDGRARTCVGWSSGGRCCTRPTAMSPVPSTGRPVSCDPEARHDPASPPRFARRRRRSGRARRLTTRGGRSRGCGCSRWPRE